MMPARSSLQAEYSHATRKHANPASRSPFAANPQTPGKPRICAQVAPQVAGPRLWPQERLVAGGGNDKPPPTGAGGG